MPAHPRQRDSLLRRVSLTPVALSPAAIRQLGRLLAPLPELGSLTVGLDPAPYTTFMPRVRTGVATALWWCLGPPEAACAALTKSLSVLTWVLLGTTQEPSEWDHWMWYEDRNDPEMAARRRRYLGLDDE